MHRGNDAALHSARTFLFVPADDVRKRRKAWTVNADAVILDLEDAVAPSVKDTARHGLAEALAERPASGSLAVVRVNALDTEDGERDLATLSDLRVDAILVPKADVTTIDRALIGHPVLALVETAAGVLQAADIARVAGVQRLMVGPVDLAGELGCDQDPANPVLQSCRVQVVLASAAARIARPIDGPSTAIGDPGRLADEAEQAQGLGFGAKACIHPGQLETVAEAFAPSPERVAWARRVTEAYERAHESGSGVIAVDGEMVDVPVAQRAYAILQRSKERS